MKNYYFKGFYENEDQLEKIKLTSDATLIDEENDSVEKSMLLGFLMEIPLLIIMLVIAVIRSKTLMGSNINEPLIILTLIISSFFSILLSIIHEIIHGVCFPSNSKKEIWIYKMGLALFIYCTESLKKSRFIIMILMPSIILGIIPYIFIICLADKINIYLAIGGFIASIIMYISGAGDYYNAYIVAKRAPRGSVLFNNGMKTYWIKLKNKNLEEK